LDDELPELFPDLVRSFTRGVLGRRDLSPSFAAQDAHEAADCVRLPARGFHDLGQCGALRALDHGDHFRLLVGAIRLRRAAWLLGPAAFFADLAFLAALRAPLGFAAWGAGLLMLSFSIPLSLIEFLLDRVAVVTVITPVGRKSKQNL
jgi:hypothetical protein